MSEDTGVNRDLPDGAALELSRGDSGAIEVHAPGADPVLAQFLQTDLAGLHGMLPELQDAIAAGKDLEVGGNAFYVRIRAGTVDLDNQWTDESISLPLALFSAYLDSYEAQARRLGEGG